MSENNQRTSNEVFTAAEAKASGFQVKDVMLEEFGYEIPVDLVPLPSEGKIYPSDNPLHNKKSVELKAMTAKEEDILTSRALIKKGTVITELIRSCMVDKRVDVDSMIAGDRNAIMVALRITGYGSDYAAEVTCPACNESSKVTFDLRTLPIKNLEVEPAEPGQNKFEFVLPVTGAKVMFKFLTGKDEQEINVVAERLKRQGQLSDNLVTEQLFNCIISVNDITDRAKIKAFVRSMRARDSLALRRYMDSIEPGIDMKSDMECNFCGERSEVRLPLGANFFWPDT